MGAQNGSHGNVLLYAFERICEMGARWTGMPEEPQPNALLVEDDSTDRMEVKIQLEVMGFTDVFKAFPNGMEPF